jgi:hypothetical protein
MWPMKTPRDIASAALATVEEYVVDVFVELGSCDAGWQPAIALTGYLCPHQRPAESTTRSYDINGAFISIDLSAILHAQHEGRRRTNIGCWSSCPPRGSSS